jgi:ribonuclease HI
MIQRLVYEKPFMVRFPDRSEWKDEFQSNRKGGLIWYTDGSETNKGTGAGICGYGIRQKLSLRLGKYTTVFQVEVYTIKACAVEALDTDYKNRNIYILSHSQAAVKTFDNYQINSKVVWDCHQSFVKLAEHNIVKLVGLPDDEGIERNETAYQLAKL